MLRFEVSEVGQEALPAVDIDDATVVIGSGAAARIRLPAHAAREVHVELTAVRWTARADVRVIGADTTQVGVLRSADPTLPETQGVLHRAGDSGAISGGITFQLGEYRVRATVAPANALAAPGQRTESLARELVRGLLGADAAPTLEIERGPVVGIKRTLPPPEVTIVVGRGEEASWIILDEDLSRAHAEIHRGWDGVTIVDRGSKNGTIVDGTKITARTPLRHGALIELGNVALRFRDPAENHLRGEATNAATPKAVRAVDRVPVASATRAPRASGAPLASGAPASSNWPFAVALAIAGLAAAGLVWILAS